MKPRLDLKLLSIAIALHEERNLTHAAQRLGISQPAASLALGKLRRIFGDPLFVRTTHGMEPTPRGLALVPPAREVLLRVERDILSEASFDPAASRHTFTFAMSDVGEMVFLPKILRNIRQSAPQASVRSVAFSPENVQYGLECGEIDLAVGYFPDLKTGNFYQQRLFDHHFSCLLRADHPIGGNKLTLQQFLGLEHAVVHSEGRSQEILERFLQRKKIRRSVALFTPHFMSIPRIIATSDLVATVPHAIGIYFTRSSANIKVVKPPLRIPPIGLKQHWHRRFHGDAKSKWLRGVVSRLFNDESDEWRE